MSYSYQFDFSANSDAMYDVEQRQRKAKTMIAVLQDYFEQPLEQFNLLNLGGSTGIIDEYLSRYFQQVTGVDIDEPAINYAQQTFKKDNLKFAVGDAMDLQYESEQFNVVICSQVYEHVPDAKQMMKEICRVLKPGGVCYFAAGNRLVWNEPHYRLPLLSVIPKCFAHWYLQLTKRGTYYYENHRTLWGLNQLVSAFTRIDYTKKIIDSPSKFGADYMLPEGSRKAKLASLIARYFYFMVPGYIWLLQKPTD
ncbi:class I SAM-dependent methyltransferase [Aliikangiella maris]|uniref:Class I SAM-dependent methyltransferase n=2 Tax=Aliikangiella maris TaxID=3162458 RepID=A0ABV2BPE8_9GAMM